MRNKIKTKMDAKKKLKEQKIKDNNIGVSTYASLELASNQREQTQELVPRTSWSQHQTISKRKFINQSSWKFSPYEVQYRAYIDYELTLFLILIDLGNHNHA